MTNRMRSGTCPAAAAAAAAAYRAWEGAATANWPAARLEGVPFRAPDEVSPNEISPDEKQDEISRMRSVRMKHQMISRK